MLRGALEALSARIAMAAPKVARGFSPPRAAAEVRERLSFFNDGKGPTPVLTTWFTWRDGQRKDEMRFMPESDLHANSLDQAIARRDWLRRFARTEQLAGYRTFLERTDFLPLVSTGTGDEYIYELQPGGWCGIAFFDHECPDVYCCEDGKTVAGVRSVGDFVDETLSRWEQVEPEPEGLLRRLVGRFRRSS